MKRPKSSYFVIKSRKNLEKKLGNLNFKNKSFMRRIKTSRPKKKEKYQKFKNINVLEESKIINDIEMFEPHSKIFSKILKKQNIKIKLGLLNHPNTISKNDYKKIEKNIKREIKEVAKCIRMPTLFDNYEEERIKDKIFEQKEKLTLFNNLLKSIDNSLYKYEIEMGKKTFEKTLTNKEINQLILKDGTITKSAIMKQSKSLVNDILEKQEKNKLERLKIIRSMKFLKSNNVELRLDDDKEELSQIEELLNGYEKQQKGIDDEKKKRKEKDLDFEEISSKITALKTRLEMSVLKLKDLFLNFKKIRKTDSNITQKSLTTINTIRKDLINSKKNLEKVNLKSIFIKKKLNEKEKECNEFKLKCFNLNEKIRKITQRIKESDSTNFDSYWILESVKDIGTNLKNSDKKFNEQEEEELKNIRDIFDPRYKTTKELIKDLSLINKPSHLRSIIAMFIQEREKVHNHLNSVHEKVQLLRNHFNYLNRKKVKELKDNFIEKWINLNIKIEKRGERLYRNKFFQDLDTVINKEKLKRDIVDEHFLDIIKESNFSKEKQHYISVSKSISGLLIKLYYDFRKQLFSDSSSTDFKKSSKLIKITKITSKFLKKNQKKNKIRGKLKKAFMDSLKADSNKSKRISRKSSFNKSNKNSNSNSKSNSMRNSINKRD